MNVDVKDNDAMTIRQMCDEYNVTARTLRFYEAKELLSPVREGQKRLFTKRDRARLKLILRGKKFGLSLEKIRQILELYEMGDGGYTQLLRSVQVAKERHIELTQQRDELNEALAELAELIKLGQTELETREKTSAA